MNFEHPNNPNKKTYYDTLGISENASQDEIKKAYRTLSLKYHPDRNPNDPTSVSMFQEINSAFEILGDVEKKKEYDFSRKNIFVGMFGDGIHHNSSGMGMDDMNDILSSLFSINLLKSITNNKLNIFIGVYPIFNNNEIIEPTDVPQNTSGETIILDSISF